MVYGDIFLRLCISENDFVLTSHFITGFPGYVAGGKLFIFTIVKTLLHWASRSLKPFGLLEYLYMTSFPPPNLLEVFRIFSLSLGFWPSTKTSRERNQFIFASFSSFLSPSYLFHCVYQLRFSLNKRESICIILSL